MTTILRLDELWTAIREQLSTSRMIELLGGEGHIYVPTDNPVDERPRDGRVNAPWGRILMLPRTTLWPQRDDHDGHRNVAWLLAVQFNDYRARGYDVNVSVDAVHEHAYRQLDDFAPQLERATIYVPLWREGTPPASAVYDAQRHLWLSNAEYRTQVIEREQVTS